MPQDLTPRLGLSRMLPAQAQKHVTFNEALERLDALTQGVLDGVDATDPPADPAEGALHALGSAPTGAWAGQGGKLALFQGGGWVFLTPAPGWHLWDATTGALRLWDGLTWTALGGDQLAELGIGTAPDATNRFAVSSDAALFTHAGDDVRLVLNKAGTGNTASFVFQSGWSGRAEFGLLGSDAFAIKTSADGAAWTVAATFTSAGNAGLGTASPARRLHVNNTVRIEPRSAAPAAPSAGDLYFDATLGKLRCHDGSAWRDLF